MRYLLSLLSSAVVFSSSAALAQGAAPADASGGLGSFIPLILIFAIFYFLLIRPQQKKLKEHQKMVLGLKRNDKVATAGGIIGTITKVNADSKTLEMKIADGVEVTVMRDMVTDLLSPKTEVEASAAETVKPLAAAKGKKK